MEEGDCDEEGKVPWSQLFWFLLFLCPEHQFVDLDFLHFQEAAKMLESSLKPNGNFDVPFSLTESLSTWNMKMTPLFMDIECNLR